VLDTRSFQPDWVSPPGATIADLLEERAISVPEFAQALQRSEEEVLHLLEGREAMTIGLARQLERTLGASVEFWMNRDFEYRLDTGRHEEEVAWLNKLPVSDMIRFGWIAPSLPNEEMEACLNFFGVTSIAEWRQTYLARPALAAFRASPTFESRPAAVAAWLRRGMLIGGEVQCEHWNAIGFRGSLKHLRGLTRIKQPSDFVPKLQERCARYGVAIVAVRTPAGCPVSGAATFLSSEKALIIVSFRHLADDHFWFTFFHECGHLLLHPDRGPFVDGEPTPDTPEERQANALAADVLVPSEARDEMLSLPLNAKEVIRFALRIGTSPGVVVGQLQHAGRIGFDQMNALKRRYQWPINSTYPRNAR